MWSSSTAAARTSPRCCFALQRLGASAEVTTDPARIRAATHVLLPGVGVGARCHDATAVPDSTRSSRSCSSRCSASASACSCCSRPPPKRPPEQAATPCLGVIPGRVARLHGRRRSSRAAHGLEPAATYCKHDPLFDGPHGWRLHVLRAQFRGAGFGRDARRLTDYGRRFRPWCGSGNFRGVQFHPERSAKCRRAPARQLSGPEGVAACC